MRLFDVQPRITPTDITLHPYQQEAVDRVRTQFAEGVRSTLLVMPTGTGKTITFGMIARKIAENNKRVLVLAHREKLVEQAVEKLDMLGVEAGVEMADRYARAAMEPDVVVASVPSLKGARLESFPPDHFWLVVTDEAHHAPAEGYQRIYRHFAPARHLGATATADRRDGQGLVGPIFEDFVEPITAPPPGPYLSRIRIKTIREVVIDLRGFRKGKDDFSDSFLAERIGPMAEFLANHIKKHIGDRPTMAFTPDVATAQAMASALEGVGVTADWTEGGDPDAKHKIAKLEEGRTQVLVNCMVYTEGADIPCLAAIVLLRPTKSRPLMAQMIGRGTRLHAGKENCLILDFPCLTDRMEVVVPVELFDAEAQDPEVVEIAKGIVKDGAAEDDGVDLIDAVRQSRQEASRRQALRVEAREREVAGRWVEVDPVAAFDVLGVGYRPAGPRSRPASEKQVALMRKLKIPGAERMSRAQASTILDVTFSRMKAGLATTPMVKLLMRKGVGVEEARSLSFEEARSRLDSLCGNRRTG
jgi:superfamily II DNA or RNA helicase